MRERASRQRAEKANRAVKQILRGGCFCLEPIALLYPERRGQWGEASYFQLNPAWRLAFISHLKITNAAGPWLNWVPSKRQHRKGKEAGSKKWTVLRAAKAPWETPASLHVKWPSVSRGQPCGCKWQAQPMSLLRLAIQVQNKELTLSLWQGHMYWVSATNSIRENLEIAITYYTYVSIWPCLNSTVALLQVISHKCVWERNDLQ